MADLKITGLTADTSPTSDDLISTVNDPAGTPANRKVTLANAITKAHGLSDGIVKVASGTMGIASAGTDYQAAGNYITALTSDVTASGPGSAAATIANDAVTNAKLANMATQTIKGRTTAGTGDPEDLTATQATAILNEFTGDAGAGGLKGLVKAPAIGDSTKFLKGDGTWATPAGSGNVSNTGTPVDNQIAVWTAATTIEGDTALTFDTTTDKLSAGGTTGSVDTGTVELGHASDTTLSRSAAGTLAVEGVDVLTTSNTKTLTNKTIDANGTGNSITNLEVADFAGSAIVTAAEGLASSDNDTSLPTTAAVIDGLDAKQPLDADLTTIAGLTATTDNFIQSKSSAWASRTPTQVTADLIAMVGDTGTGGTKGLVPAPAAGDAAASKFLKADGTWAVAGSGSVATDTIWDAKGDLAVGTGSNTAARLAVGANGTVLTADSAEVTGLKWATPAGGGDVLKVGTPVNNQIGVWTGDGTLEGDSALTFDTATDTLAVAASGKIAMGAVNIIDDTAGTTTLSNIDALDATTEATVEAAIDTLANLTSIQGRTVTLADAGANAIFGWDDVAGAYENLTQAEVLAVVGDSTATAKGVVELATDAETVTGTDTARATTPANITAKMAAPGTIGGTTPGAATFTTLTATTVNAFTTGGNITLAENTSIALDPAGSADGKYSGITVAGTAGEALAFGDVIVLDVTAGKWFKGSVSAAAGADGDLRGGVGMCVLAAAEDASATVVLLSGTCRADANFPALTIGSVVYATTLGDITVTQPTTTDHVIKVLGFALTADEIMFNPSMDWMVHT